MKIANLNTGKSTSSSDRALTGALVGAGLCVPALLAASQFMPLGILEALAALTGGSVVGSGLAIASSRYTSKKANNIDAAPLSEKAHLLPVSELVLRHDKNGDVLVHSGTNHLELAELADGLFGKGLLNLIRISDRPAYLKAISDAEHGRTPEIVNLHLAVSQTPRTYQAFAFAARPTPNGSESSLSDISKELQLEQSLRDAPSTGAVETQLARAASHMAHELRSPLNSILGFSEMLAGESYDRFSDVQRKEYAAHIHQSGTHLLGVIDNMLDMGRLEAGKLELTQNIFDVGLLCHESVSILEPQVSESALEIEIDCPHDLPPLYADEKCCRQMLLNLLSNAIKFTSGAGQVSLTARHVKGHIEFEVKDSGIGIPDEALSRLGRPFERVEGTDVPGTGLGLSLVRQMVALHGGSFRLESILGEGTTATLSLPCVRAAAGNPSSDRLAEKDGGLQTNLPDFTDSQRRIA